MTPLARLERLQAERRVKDARFELHQARGALADAENALLLAEGGLLAAQADFDAATDALTGLPVTASERGRGTRSTRGGMTPRSPCSDSRSTLASTSSERSSRRLRRPETPKSKSWEGPSSRWTCCSHYPERLQLPRLLLGFAQSQVSQYRLMPTVPRP